MASLPEGMGAVWAERALDASGVVLLIADAAGTVLHVSAGGQRFFTHAALCRASLLELIDGLTPPLLGSIAAGQTEPTHLFVQQSAVERPIAGAPAGATVAPLGDQTHVVCTINTISALHRALGEIEDVVRAASSEGLWDYELSTGRVWWSPQVAVILGRVGDPLIGSIEDRFEKIIHEHDFTRTQASLQAMLSDDEIEYNVEARCLCAHGKYRWMLLRGKALRGATGRPLRVAGSILDIHDRREVEQALRESERRSRELSNQLPQFIWEAQPDGIIDTINDRYFELTGVSRDRIINETSLSITHPDDQKHALTEWLWCIQNGADYEVESRFWFENQRQYRWILTQARPRRDSTGQIVRWYGTGTDIHDRKMAELRVRESEQRFRLLADSAPVLIWVTDETARIEFINRAGIEFIGCQPPGDHAAWYAAMHPDHADEMVAKLRAAIAESRGFDMELRVRSASRGDRWVLCTVAPRQDPSGQAVGAVAVALDITDRKAEESLTRRLMDELDHRVKNNLAAIMYMCKQSLASATSLEAFERSFTPRLLAMARTHEALARQHWSSVPLREVVEIAVRPFEPDLGTRVRIEGPDVQLSAPKAGPMGLVLHELASNAARHGTLRWPDGQLTVRWTRQQNGEIDLRWTERHSGGLASSGVGARPGARPGARAGARYGSADLAANLTDECVGSGVNGAREPAERSGGASGHTTTCASSGVGLSLVKGLIDFDLRGWVDLSYSSNGADHRIVFNPASDADDRRDG